MRKSIGFVAAGILALAIGCGDDDTKNSPDAGASRHDAAPGAGGTGGGAGGAGGRSIVTGGLCPESSGGAPCEGEAEYQACLTGACSTQLAACFGPNYASGVIAGVCSAVMNCVLACPCDATASSCETACYLSALTDSTCLTCIQSLGACSDASGCVEPSCLPGTGRDASVPLGPDASTSTGRDASVPLGPDAPTSTDGSCVKAIACCDQLGALGGAEYVAQCKAALTGQTDAVCAQLLAQYAQLGMCQ